MRPRKGNNMSELPREKVEQDWNDQIPDEENDRTEEYERTLQGRKRTE